MVEKSRGTSSIIAFLEREDVHQLQTDLNGMIERNKSLVREKHFPLAPGHVGFDLGSQQSFSKSVGDCTSQYRVQELQAAIHRTGQQ